MNIGDIVERNERKTDPPSAPRPPSAPKKWSLKQRAPTPPAPKSPATDASLAQPAGPSSGHAPQSSTPAGSASASQPPLSEDEKIHLENVRRLASMTPEQMELEKEQLMGSLDPKVLQSLLRRAELKERTDKDTQPAEVKERTAKDTESTGPKNTAASGSESSDMIIDSHTEANTAANAHNTYAPEAETKAGPEGEEKKKSVRFGTVDVKELEGAGTSRPPHRTAEPSPPLDDGLKRQTAAEIQRIETSINAARETHKSPAANSSQLTQEAESARPMTHFPPPPDELRKYFPDLPVETDKLAWMQPISQQEEDEYSSEMVSLAPSELRFDFAGNLVTPRQSRQISHDSGLHHHGDAPSAAGYTIPEIAHLCRSTNNAQRSLAIQTAGRVLHKLYSGRFRKSSELQEGLEALVDRTHIVDSLVEAASDKTRSLTVRTMATEAVWLVESARGASAKPIE